MDETIRKPDIGATIRVDAAPTNSKSNIETTVRPGSVADDSQAGDGDFILKGRIYRGIKCLSDNSGEAQVYLVHGEEGANGIEDILSQFYHQEAVDAHCAELQYGDAGSCC